MATDSKNKKKSSSPVSGFNSGPRLDGLIACAVLQLICEISLWNLGTSAENFHQILGVIEVLLVVCVLILKRETSRTFQGFNFINKT